MAVCVFVRCGPLAHARKTQYGNWDSLSITEAPAALAQHSDALSTESLLLLHEKGRGRKYCSDEGLHKRGATAIAHPQAPGRVQKPWNANDRDN